MSESIKPEEVGLIYKLVKIMGELPVIGKNGRNDFHRYNYAMEVDFLEAVRPKLVEYGIFMTMSVDSIQIDSRGTGEKEAKITTIRTSHTFHDSHTGEKLTFLGAGQGEDKGDKGIYKAQTGALKYAISKAFMIATGDDPEAFHERRVEAGKVRKEKGAVPPQAPPNAKGAPAVPTGQPNPNPCVTKIVNISVPSEGKYAKGPREGQTFTYWKIQTDAMDFTTFDKGLVEVAANAQTDGHKVSIIWQRPAGKDYNNAVGIVDLDAPKA